MDKIGSNPYFNVYNAYRKEMPARPAESSGQPQPLSAQNVHAAPDAVAGAKGYANMFEDDALLSLQRNLLSVSDFAERALKRLDV